MIRLLSIEWLKLKNYKVFWILFSLYFAGIMLVCSSGLFFLRYLKKEGIDFEGFDPTQIPIYNFPDIWQNITYLATFFKLLLAFIVIISVTNEITYRTLRQNIIDGLDKKDFLVSKLTLVFALSAIASIFLALYIYVLGVIHTSNFSMNQAFNGIGFIPVFFIEVFTYLSLALLAALLFKKAGFVIVLLFMYTLILEPFLALILEHAPFIPDYLANTKDYLPIKSLNNLIKIPFQRYILRPIQDYVKLTELVIVLVWLVIYNGLSILILKIRNV